MAGKTSGSELVNGLDGSDQAKDWCKAILDTLSGATTVVDAARSLGCNQAYFYRVRGRALQAMLSDLEPKRTGRKPAEHDPQATRIAELEAELLHAKGALEAASARVTVALGAPSSTRRPKGRRRAHPTS
ncbi:MAG: hypothetical protein M9894_15785 [Planctomycetes bacterium]|nr:hypothetical protein [Planctomycetota bacterium]MCO5167806.1 hypothetical protein [Planctomycetota bacterium]